VPVIWFGSSADCVHVRNADLMVTDIQHAACNLCRVLSSLLGRYRIIALKRNVGLFLFTIEYFNWSGA